MTTEDMPLAVEDDPRTRLEDEILARYPQESLRGIAVSLGISPKLAYKEARWLERRGVLRFLNPSERVSMGNSKRPKKGPKRDAQGRFVRVIDMRKLSGRRKK